MPQYRVTVKEYPSGLIHKLSVWSDNRRNANLIAARNAKRLLGIDDVVIVGTKELDGTLKR